MLKPANWQDHPLDWWILNFLVFSNTWNKQQKKQRDSCAIILADTVFNPLLLWRFQVVYTSLIFYDKEYHILLNAKILTIKKERKVIYLKTLGWFLTYSSSLLYQPSLHWFQCGNSWASKRECNWREAGGNWRHKMQRSHSWDNNNLLKTEMRQEKAWPNSQPGALHSNRSNCHAFSTARNTGER